MPLVEFVIVSSFSKMIPADPVTSRLVLAVIVVKDPAAADAPPIIDPSIAPLSIFTLVMALVPKSETALISRALSTWIFSPLFVVTKVI